MKYMAKELMLSSLEKVSTRATIQYMYLMSCQQLLYSYHMLQNIIAMIKLSHVTLVEIQL